MAEIETLLRSRLGVGFDELFGRRGALVAGSYPLKVYMGGDTFDNNDIDIWLPYISEKELGEILGRKVERGPSRYYYRWSTAIISYVYTLDASDADAKPIQLVVLVDGITPQDAVEDFDISVCKVAWRPDTGFTLYGGDPKTMTMTVHREKVWDVATLRRLVKYHERGWRLDGESTAVLRSCYGDSIEIVGMLHKLRAIP